MYRNFRLILVLAGIGALVPKEAGSAGRQERTRLDYPLYCAGIVVGMTTDRDVIRMYGRGLFVKSEGHGGGRYYVDAQRTCTLHVEIGVDSYIESVSYGKGVRLPASLRKELGKASPPSLSSKEWIGTGMGLEDTAAAVLRQLGKPTSDHRSGKGRVIRYETDYHRNPYVLVYESRWEFVGDRLVAVQLYNGE